MPFFGSARSDGGPRGEMSAQVNVNNLDATQTVFPGYEAWLSSVGLDGYGVVIANVDTGIDESHPQDSGRRPHLAGALQLHLRRQEIAVRAQVGDSEVPGAGLP